MTARQVGSPVSSAGVEPGIENGRHTVFGGMVDAFFGNARSALGRLVFLAFLLATFLLCCFPLMDTDLWWHLRTGELILEHGELPYVDWFTFTDVDRPWIDLHWGFQLLMTLLYRVGGTDLIILFKAGVITLAVAVAWHATGRNVPIWLKALVWLMPLITISGRAYERPEMLTQLFLAMWLWIIPRLPQRPRLIWFLPVIQVIWVNCHSLFVLGLVVGVASVVDRLVRLGAKGRWGLATAEDEPKALTCQVAGLLIALACFVNPYFEEGALFPLEVYRKFTVDQDYYSARVGEFQQPIAFILQHGFGNVYLLSEIGIWLVAATSFVALALRRRWSPFRLTLFGGFSHLAWEATRNSNIFAIVSVVMTMANLQDWLTIGSAPATDKTEKPSRGASDLLAPGNASSLPSRTSKRHLANVATWTMIVVYGALIVAVVTGGWHRFAGENRSFRLGEREGWFAHSAAKFAGQPGFPMRAYVANNGQAAVYSYHNGPDRRVFMDGRLEVCTRRTFEMFDAISLAMATGDFRWQDALRDAEGRLPVVILDSRYSRLQINGLMNTPGWKLVFADAAAAVFVDDRVASRLSLRAADPAPLLYPP